MTGGVSLGTIAAGGDLEKSPFGNLLHADDIAGPRHPA